MSNKGVMLDLETFGTKQGCVIRSIGAVVFDIDAGELTDEFYINVDTQSCLDVGLFIDPRTAEWWKRQEQQAQDALMVNPQPVNIAVAEFCKWFRAQNVPNVWCQGANFDAPIIEEVITRVRFPVPWKFWAVRDTRTAYDIWGFDPKTFPREGTYHNALDDAKYQARCLIAAKRVFANPIAKSISAVKENLLGDLL